MKSRFPHLGLPAILISALLVGIFALTVIRFRTSLRAEIRQTIIERDAAVLRPVALRQLAQRENALARDADLFTAVLESAQQENMLAVAIFDEEGQTLHFAPESLLLAEMPLDDFFRLFKEESISRFHPALPLNRYFSGIAAAPGGQTAPVLEVLLRLHGRDPEKILGFAHYYIDGRPLAAELAVIDERVNQQTAATLLIGITLIAGILTLAYIGLRRAQRMVAERNEQLLRANFELTLAAKASALGQITSHLIHGLQGSVAGLRAVVAGRDGNSATTDWETAAGYTDRMQSMIQEAVALLSDSSANTAYELTGHELADIVRRRNLPAAEKKGVLFHVSGGFDRALDSHRGGLLCLIASNLVNNAVDATDAGRNVSVIFRNGGERASVIVSDEGRGIPDGVRAHLFEPGCTGRSGGSGLGLAISQLLARQIGASLELESTGPSGTVFRLTLPLSE